MQKKVKIIGQKSLIHTFIKYEEQD